MEKLRGKFREVIFGTDTVMGRTFDIVLIILIVLSVATVMLESVDLLRSRFSTSFFFAEWFFTVVFTIEYFLRIFCLKKPATYVFSFFGLVDLFAIIPTYLSFFFPGAQGLLIIRGLRLLRIFRILKLSRYTTASQVLYQALAQSRHKITVFLGVIVTLVLIVGAVMYLVEGKQNGFVNIPQSVYWAVVTITTVGYGDIAPATPLGQFIAALLMVAGYGIIAVPTGIVSVELANVTKNLDFARECSRCLKKGHQDLAKHCFNCGEKLPVV